MVVQVPAEGQAKALHLIVLHHGLWGNPQHLNALVFMLRERVGPDVEILNSKVNEHDTSQCLTYDGIDLCGLRLAADVTNTVVALAAAGRQVTQVSFIGYSMGGLVQRYACGKLYTSGWLTTDLTKHETGLKHGSGLSQEHAQGPEPDSPSAPTTRSSKDPLSQAASPPLFQTQTDPPACTLKQNTASCSPSLPATCTSTDLPPCPRPLEPVCFVTIATPHLGSWRLPTSLISRCFNSMVQALVSMSGAQLMLADASVHAQPLLVNMCDPDLPFYQALSAFKHRALLANVYNDRMVPFCTAAIEAENMFECCRPEPISAMYPSVVCLPKQLTARVRACPKNGPQSAAIWEQTNVDTANQQELKHRQQHSDVRAAKQEAHSAGQAQKVVPPRFRGLGMRLLVVLLLLLLLPISLPLIMALMLYLWILGRQHASKASKRDLDHSWLTGGKTNQQLESTAIHPSPSRHPGSSTYCQGEQQERGTALPRNTPLPRLPPSSAAQAPSPQIMLVRDAPSSTHTPASARTGAGRHGDVEESEQQLCHGEVGAGDIDVVFDDATQMHVHEGLVKDSAVGIAHRQHQQQLWMCKQLNSLSWEKVPIDTRHYHAHAAIILRNPSRFRANADCLQYLIDQILLPRLLGP